MEDYITLENIYKAFCKADMGEFCRHHIEALSMNLKRYGETWIPVNCAKQFADYAGHRLKCSVILTDKKEPSPYYKAGEVQQIKLPTL